VSEWEAASRREEKERLLRTRAEIRRNAPNSAKKRLKVPISERIFPLAWN
jgi:hypothetical protein